ncbi:MULTISPECIES: histidine phosphatase family protein [unclassified Streptomyces]|uniref:histidine phosphatase family protein n=1 Tax=unclassified Streptomyces TaxID=2593676 RepID=UPI0033AB3E26
MTIRLMLLCAPVPSGRETRFADGPLDERAVQQARAAAGALPATGVRYTAPSQRCRQTAQALGWDAAVEPALCDIGVGSWHGRTLDEVAASDPAGLAAWMTDPGAAPHGGETVADVCTRVTAWLDTLQGESGPVTAVVEQAVTRAAVVSVLGAPHASFWRIDIPPLTAVHLTGRAGRWNLRLGAAMSAGA